MKEHVGKAPGKKHTSPEHRLAKEGLGAKEKRHGGGGGKQTLSYRHSLSPGETIETLSGFTWQETVELGFEDKSTYKPLAIIL